MGGAIDVSSEVQKGSTFSVYLPAKVISWQSVPKKKSENIVKIPYYAGQKMLVVEDNFINQEIIKALLDKTKAKVLVANNGQEAVDIFTDQRDISCIFMDMHMPIMNGIEATQEIRKINKDIPIIAISAATAQEDQQKALLAGISEYMFKPIDTAVLYGFLEKYCKPSQEMQEIKKSVSKEPTVLIVDDSPANIRTLSSMLKDKYSIKVATNGKKALEIAAHTHLDLILLDIVMPQMDGYEVCRILKENEDTADIPIIFVTAKDSQEDETYGLSMGAVDYITKPFHQEVVKARITRHLLMKQKRDVLTSLSLEDGLTKIPNRRSFDQYLENQFARTDRAEDSICMMMIDIDFFKAYNDNYGHDKGDKTLYAVAQSLSSSLKRPADFLARYGGEEFVCVINSVDFHGVKQIARRLIENVQALQIEHLYSEASKYVTISLGLAYCSKEQSKLSKEELLHRADEALYEAKSTGRNTYVACEIIGESLAKP